MMSVGASGVISVVANVAPRETMEMVDSFHSNTKKAISLHKRLFPLTKAMFVESNPGPVKKALELMGIVSSETRLPLVAVSEDSASKIRDELRRFGIGMDAKVTK
jgi:4-hydroxy-tetrahydrodipicolinate synthase